MLQKLRSAWLARKSERIKQADKEFQQVLKELRDLGRNATSSDIEEFKKSPFVARLKTPYQYGNIANLIFKNANKDTIEYQKAIALWKTAMELGSESAKYSYAQMLREGTGLPKKYPNEATNLFRELSTKGHGWGTYAYAVALEKGEGTGKNVSKALELYLKCAEANIPPSYWNIATLYMDGSGKDVPKNVREGLKYLHKAAESGDPKALSKLGQLYLNGKKGVVDTPDPIKAVEYFTLAASKGDPISQFNLADCYLNGSYGVKQDYRRAETLFRRAADQGFVMAMVNLAQMYTIGFREVPKDYELAKKWLSLASPHDPNAKELLRRLEEKVELEKK